MTYNIKESEKRGLQGLLASLELSVKPVDSFTQFRKIEAIASVDELRLLRRIHDILERNDEVTLLFRH